MRKWIFIFFPLALFSLEKQPWFSDVYEFHLLAGYTYSHYNSINKETTPNTGSSDHLVDLNLETSPSAQWSIDGELSFVDTTRQSFSFQSVALQGRYLWMDDIVGDFMSLATGVSARLNSRRSLRDVSCPYHGTGEFALNVSFGKEFDQSRYSRYRLWAFGLVGFATTGSPWFNGTVSLEGNYFDQHKWALFFDGGHGYGKKTRVSTENFFGYGKVRYKYLDLGVRYGYKLGVMGTIRLQYMRRLLAGAYPQDVNFFTVAYLVPFSF